MNGSGGEAGQEALQLAVRTKMIVFEEIAQPLEPVRIERAWSWPERVRQRAVSRWTLD